MIELAECFATHPAAEWITLKTAQTAPQDLKKNSSSSFGIMRTTAMTAPHPWKNEDFFLEIIMHNENNSSDSTPDQRHKDFFAHFAL